MRFFTPRPPFLRILCLVLILFRPVAAQAAGYVPYHGFSLEAARPASWWHLGDTVEYRVDGALPPDVAAVEGVVSTASGGEVARVRTDRAELAASGWQWKAAAPGYYEVRFFSIDAANARAAIGWSYKLRGADGATGDFTCEARGFAVMPRPATPPGRVRDGQFGFICDTPDADDIPLADLIGFDWLRLLVPWGAAFTNLTRAVEPSQGDYHWQQLDEAVGRFAQAGFDIYAQVLYTPVWASPHPEEADSINICVRKATAYAPKDLADFSRFVEAAVTRYKDRIHAWEMWNEPSIPGGSCFWSGTVDDYAALLAAGFQAVKKADPQAAVAIGGIGGSSPYMAFYDQLLKRGGGGSFDILSLHGRFVGPDDGYRQIEEAYHVAPKPAMQTEWHAILQGNMQSGPILSDPALSFRMMKDLLYHLKHGVERIALFEMKNLVEKETLGFYMEHKSFVHSSGIFRRAPRLEPRQPAVVLANFIDLAGHRASYLREIKLRGDATAVALSTGHGPLIAFWTEGETLPLAGLGLQAFATPESVLRDWEGKRLPFDEKSILAGKQIYYLDGVDGQAVTQAETADRLLSPRAAAPASRQTVEASFSGGKLFDAADGPVPAPAAGWIDAGWKLTKLGAHNPAFSCRAAVGIHPEGVDVVVEVHDPVHFQKDAAPSWWNGDSVQIAIDCTGRGTAGGNAEFLAALTDQGPATWKISAADSFGDIPTRRSPGGAVAQYVEQWIARDGGITRYQIRIPWTELFPLTYDPRKPLHLALVVNDNDGNGRAEYLSWGGGIAEDKDPSLYGVVHPPAEK